MISTIEELKVLFPSFDGHCAGSVIERVNTDSRQSVANSLFIPLVGERFNGHDYIEQAIEHGALATLWDRQYPVPESLKKNCCFFYVDDTLSGLHELAVYYRKRINPTVIGITGSNGKTTTKDILSSILKTTYQTHYTAGNFNNAIGLPLTILSMPEETEMLVLEMGMNDFGEISLLSRLAEPSYAIITNIGESHIEHLGSREGIARAKLEILDGLTAEGRLIIDGDEPLLTERSYRFPVYACSFYQEGSKMEKISEVEVSLAESRFRLGQVAYRIPLTGAHHAKNASYAITLARLLGLDQEKIQAGLQRIETSDMRFEQVSGIHGATVINDAYNASPTSMIAAIQLMKSIGQFKRRILVLGDVLELGQESNHYHQKIGQAITEPIDLVFTIGEQAKVIHQSIQAQGVAVQSLHFTDQASLLQALKGYLSEETIVLFKASRGMAFEGMVAEITQ